MSYQLRSHPEVVWRDMDDARAREVRRLVIQLRSKAAKKVPEWTPRMRSVKARQEADWGSDWYE